LAGNWLKYGVTKQIDDQYFYSTAILKLIEVAGFSEEELKIGEYMCFDHRGHMGLLKSTLNNIYKKVIPESDFNIDESRTTIHYEQYGRRFYGTSLAH
jgi:predicted transcriptional regulator YdeE